jgi:hypothetical protein
MSDGNGIRWGSQHGGECGTQERGGRRDAEGRGGRDLGFEIWDLRFGIWDLGFEIFWGL